MAVDKQVVLQPRDLRIMKELQSFRYVDIEQAKAIGSFGSFIRTRARLLRLFRAGHLDRMLLGTIAGGRKAIYFLPDSRHRRRSVSHLQSSQRATFVAHQLAINEVMLLACHQRVGVEWSSGERIAGDGQDLIPDATIRVADGDQLRVLFLELDLESESAAVWQRKIGSYLSFAHSGAVLEQLGAPTFRVLVVAVTEDRIRAIRFLIARSTDQVFYVATIDQVRAQGFWSPIWQRPVGDQKHALLN